MKKITLKKGCIGKTLRLVNLIALCGSLIAIMYFYVERIEELDKAQSKIVQHESSLNHQKDLNISLVNDLSALNKSQMDLKSKNDKMLKDNATLDRKLKRQTDKVIYLKQKLKQSELQAESQENKHQAQLAKK